jgi:hypothetical protein
MGLAELTPADHRFGHWPKILWKGTQAEEIISGLAEFVTRDTDTSELGSALTCIDNGLFCSTSLRSLCIPSSVLPIGALRSER